MIQLTGFSEPEFRNPLHIFRDEDDDDEEEEEYVKSKTKFDMLAIAKLLENGNENDTKQLRNNKIHSIGLTSAKDFIQSQRCLVIDEDIPIHLIEENLIFDEWHYVTNPSETFVQQEMYKINTTPSSRQSTIADSIVSDFNSDDLSTQEDTTEWKLELPWNKTRIKKNLKTYLKRKLPSRSTDSFELKQRDTLMPKRLCFD